MPTIAALLVMTSEVSLVMLAPGSLGPCRRSACDDLKRSTDVRTVLGDALVNAAMKCTAEDALFAIKRSKRLNSLIRKMGSLDRERMVGNPDTTQLAAIISALVRKGLESMALARTLT